MKADMDLPVECDSPKARLDQVARWDGESRKMERYRGTVKQLDAAPRRNRLRVRNDICKIERIWAEWNVLMVKLCPNFNIPGSRNAAAIQAFMKGLAPSQFACESRALIEIQWIQIRGGRSASTMTIGETLTFTSSATYAALTEDFQKEQPQTRRGS